MIETIIKKIDIATKREEVADCLSGLKMVDLVKIAKHYEIGKRENKPKMIEAIISFTVGSRITRAIILGDARE